MIKTPYFALFSLFAILLLGARELSGQSVNCPQCSSGICEGESLGDYITFSGHSLPIIITSVSGAAVGTGISLSGYIFSSGNTITVNFSDGVGSSFSETLNVSIDDVNALFTFNQTGGCLQGNLNASSSTSDGTITSYIWNISQIIDGNSVPLTTLGGISTSFAFPEAGEYQICLTITDNNGCSDISCESVTIQGPNPELIFLEDGTDILAAAPNDPFLISYCNFSLSQDFDLYVSDNSNLTGGGSITSYIIEVNGTEIYNSGSAPADLILIEELPGYSGYSEVTLTITTSDGCTSSVTYDVYLGQSILPQFTAQIADINLNCPDTEIEIQTNISADNPEGVDYELFIVCDPTNLSNPLAYFSWEQTEPEAFVYWTPSESSCGCFNNSYYLVTTATHPCNPTPLPDQVDFQVALPADAEFQRSPGGNLCDQEMGAFEWLFADEIIPGVTWCDADADWIITDENGINVPINGTNSDELMSHTFSGPGTYEVCLELFTVCGDPNYCETVCINPSLSDVTLTPNWNIPPLLCPGDEFTSVLTYSNLDFCDTPEITWELFFEGGLIESFAGLNADINDLEKGEYELVVTFTLDDCGDIDENIFFEVVAPPIISPQKIGPFSDACEGDLICFDEWFCIDDCGDALIDFELILYEGFLSDCDATPSGALADVITDQLPSPPYADCDPTAVCSYQWIAEPGQYTLWIKAENNCGSDFECITIDIPFPNIPVITGDEEVCMNREVELNASLVGGSFTFDSCPLGCPTPGNGPGQFTTSGSTLSWDIQEGLTPPGDYIISYGGDCIGTGQITITVQPLPEFSIQTTIPSTVCEGDLVDLDIDYLGPNALDGCNWVYVNTGLSISNPDCQVFVDPAPGSNQYSVTVTDENGCEASESIDIEELTQPFTTDCSALQGAYCNNEGAIIDLTTILTPYPATGVLSWTLDGASITGTNVDLDGLSDGTYTLGWEWMHPTSPNCLFEGECSFDIAPPVVPTLSGNAEYCQGETVTANVSGSNGIQGNWNFVSCPGTCPTDAVFSPFTFSWITDQNDDAGTYILEYSGACLETVTYSFVLNAIPVFTIATDPGEVICGDESVTLDINYTGSSTIQECFWVNENDGTSISPPDCEITVQPSADLTTYSVIVTDANGCENSAEVDIAIQTQPFTFNCASIEPVYCDNETATINFTDLVSTNPDASEFQWFLNGNPLPGTTLDIESLSAVDSPFTLSYVYTSSQSPNCVFEGECGFSITDLTAPTITNNGPVCAGGELSAIISANNGLIGTWTFTSCPNNDCPTDFTSTGTSLFWQTTATTEPGDYVLTYTGNCLEDVQTVMTVNELPDISIEAVPGEVICDGDEVNLNLIYIGGGNVTCTWENITTGTPLADSGCSVTTFLTTDTESIAVFVSDDSGCASSDTIDISIQVQPFDFSCPTVTSYCDNEAATISLVDLVSIDPSASEFQWFLNGDLLIGTSLDIESLSSTDSPFTLSYVYTSSQSPNCVFEGECNFVVTDLTTPTISNNGPVCAGGELSAIVSGNNGLIGSWTFTSCPNNDCPTDFTSTGTSLLWQTTFDTEPGDYTVSYTGVCLEDVQTVMTVNELPDISIEAVPGELICDGDQVTLNLIYNGGGNVTCTWENITSGTPLVDNSCSVSTFLNADTESIAVFVSDDNGCASSDTIDVSIQNQPFDFSCPAITSYCDNEAVIIDFSDLVSIDPSSSGFSWFLDGNQISDSFLDLEPLDPAGSPYELSYTYDHPDAPNCGFSGSCILTISALTPPFIISDGPICLGEEITVEISQNNGFTGTWSFTSCPGICPDDFTTTDLTLTWVTSVADTPGTYTVQYAGNCLETVTETFTVQALPDFTILSDPDATVCNGDSISLSVNNLGATDILSCEWSNSQGIVDALNCAIDVLPDGSGETYYVEVTDINGCQASDSIELNIQPQPFTFDCSPISTSYCDNEVVTIDLEDLTGIDPTVDFTWFLNGTPITGQFLDIEALPPAAEPYVLTYEYLHPIAPNCLFSDSCSFSITDLTLPEISGIDAACINDSILLTSSNTNGFEGSWTFTDCPGGDCPTNIQTNADSLIWLTDALVNIPGTYEVQYTGTCLDTALFIITVQPLPSFNVLSSPGETVCAEDTITIEIEYTGSSSIVSCFLTDGLGTQITQDGFCQYTLLPENLQGPYNLEVVDLNGCINSTPFQIDIQEQPFEFDCTLESTYCDNSTDVIDLDAQISPFPVNGSLSWFINGAPSPSSTLAIFDLPPGDYTLTYVYEHGDSPFCTFSDTCNFQVTELVRPDLSGQFGYCQGETVELFADSLEGFTGEWINVSCPQPPCIPTGTNPASFTWSSVDAPLGEYVFSYEGLCLLTETYVIEILGNPTVDWTPEDATPCLNECLPFFPDIVEDEDLFGWEYHTFSDTVQLFGNEVCFDAIGNPEELDICLWAEAYHPVRDTVFTCYVSDCETITPVFSPDNPPVTPTEACPGVVLEIGVDYSFYDDCAFTLNNTVYDDCEEILIPDGPYGTFPYMIELGYSGCSDSLFGNIFIPQPPSAELEIEYDPCIPDVFAELIDLEGMALNFDWSVTDNVGVNYDFLMSDDSQETPVPNPIPLSQLNLPTDTTFYIEVEVFNFCESLTLEDTVNYIAAPSIEIDIANTSGDLFCLPQEFDFEIGEFATAYIDSVSWIFESIYDYGNVTDTTYTNLQFPPSLTFENNGQTDTVNVYVTAYNQCGLDQDTINFVLIPPNVYLEMPDFFEGVCPGDGIDIPTLIVEGDPFNGCEVTSSPLIPGLTFGCSENFESVSVFIPESTPPGTYSIETTISGCGSSNDFTEIEIFTVPDVDFEFDDQVCTDTEVAFTNLTEGAVSFEWDFGELGATDNTSILSFPVYAYEWPGIYVVTLTAFSDSNCVASVTKPIEIFGPNPSFEIDSAQICSGGTAVVEFESQDDIISLLWEFVLPGEDTLLYTVEQSVANTFFNDSNNVDIWNVSLTLEDIYGCVARADTQVIVLPQPTAFFRQNSLEGCAQGVPIDFYNLSTANTSSTWSFDNPLSNVPSIKYETNPTYEFPQPGIYTVTLLAQNQYGCEAQFARILGCNKVDVYVPNAFTPDGNSLNEVFIPVVPGIESIVFTEANFYTFQVFDRWGLMVFETNDYQEGWAGTSPNAEFYAPSDVYIWRLEINFPEGLEKWMGHVTLVR